MFARWNVPMWLFVWSIYLIVVGVIQIHVLETNSARLSGLGSAVMATGPSIRESFVAFLSNQSTPFVSACAERHATLDRSDSHGNGKQGRNEAEGEERERRKCNAVPGHFSNRVNAMTVELFIAPIFTTTTMSTARSTSSSVKMTNPMRSVIIPDTDMFDAFATRRALRSYRRLVLPPPRITVLLPPSNSNTRNVTSSSNSDQLAKLLRNEPGVTVDRRVDTNFLGTPLFNSLVERANQSDADITVLLTSGFGGGTTRTPTIGRHHRKAMLSSSFDVSLPRSFMASLRRVAATFDDFLLISSRFDAVDEALSDNPSISNGRINNDTVEMDDGAYDEELSKHVFYTGRLHTTSRSVEDNDDDDDYLGELGADDGNDVTVWAWNTNGPRLFDDRVSMPPFAHGAGVHDDWLTQQAIAAGHRPVIDATETGLVVRLLSSSSSDSDTSSASNSGSVGLEDEQSIQSRAKLQQHMRAAADFARRVDLTMTSSVHNKLLSHMSVSPDDPLSLSRKAHLLQRLINLYLSMSFSSDKAAAPTLMNGRLRHEVGRSRASSGGVLAAPWKLVHCVENQVGLYGVCIMRRLRPDVCPCEQTPFMRGSTRADPRRASRSSSLVQCGQVPRRVVSRGNASTIPTVVGNGSGWRGGGALGRKGKTGLDAGGGPQLIDESGNERAEEQPFGWPLMLRDVISTVTHRGDGSAEEDSHGHGDEGEYGKGSSNGSGLSTVFLTATVSASGTQLMSWVCNMRLLSLFNFIIAALDEKAYRYAYLRGLPVYLFHDTSGSHGRSDPSDASSAAVAVAERYVKSVKTRKTKQEPLPLIPLAVQLGIVAQVLRLGLNVVWVDCHDETMRFVSNPLPDLRTRYLHHNTHTDIAVLPCAQHRSGSVKNRRNGRHGLFVVAASKRTAALLEHMVTTTSTSTNSSRAVTLYDTLCEKKTRMSDNAGMKCEYNRKTVVVAVLDSTKYVVLGKEEDTSNEDSDKDINARSEQGDVDDVDVDVATARRKWPGILVLSARSATGRGREQTEGEGRMGKEGERRQLFDERNEVCRYEWLTRTDGG